MVSPTLREPSPEHTTSAERTIDVAIDNPRTPAVLRGASGNVAATSEEDDESDVADDDGSGGLTELDLSEHEYHHGRQAVPMRSPGDELEIDLDADDAGSGRRRRRLPSLRNRHFFEGEDAGFARPSGRGRMMQRITFRRRKGGEMDTFWTGVFIANLLSLALMSVLMSYLLQTDFFESHQSDLFGTTVDNRFTVVSPESTDAKIYMKSGYSTSRYSEAMIAFGNGELKIGRRALAKTDAQGFYGLSIANNGSTTFTNKLIAPFVKTDYLHAVRAVVFDDGTAMTTAANLSGGINEVGDVNLNSKTGSVTMSAGGKPVLKVDPDATVNFLNNGEEDLELSGITFDAASGEISIASTFKIHHDENASVISSSLPIELNSTSLVIGSANSTKAVITVPSVVDGETVYKKMALAIAGQSSNNQSDGGDVVISGGDGANRGGDVVVLGGESVENDDGDMVRGSVLINAKLERTTLSTTEIGSHSKSHSVRLHGTVSINNATDSGHGTSLYIGGGSVLATSKNVTINNFAANGSTLVVNSKSINLQASSSAALSLNENATRLVGSRELSMSVAHKINSTHSANLSIDNAGQITLNASRSINLNALGGNSSINLIGALRFGGDFSEENNTDSVPDMMLEDGSITIDADSLIVGGSGTTDSVSLMAKDITVGNVSQKSNLHIAGENVSMLCNQVEVGTPDSHIAVKGKEINIRGQSSKNSTSASLSITGSSIVVTGIDVTVGDKSAKSITIGASSSDRVSIVSSALDLGASAKSVTIGEKATAVVIGSEATTVDIKGKVTVNGEPFNARRRLESVETMFFAIARTDSAIVPLPSSDEEVHVPVHLKINPSNNLIETGEGDLQLVHSGATSAITHLRVGLTLDGVRWRVESDASAVRAASWRLPKLRCRVYSAEEPAAVLVEVVTQLETCEDDEDCRAGFFVGASSQRIVAVQAGDRLSVRCAGSPTGIHGGGFRMVLIDTVQLDVSSLA